MKFKRLLIIIGVVACALYACMGCSDYSLDNVQEQINQIQTQAEDVLDGVSSYLDNAGTASQDAESTETTAGQTAEEQSEAVEITYSGSFDLSTVPEYDGTSAYAVVNDNIPYFTESDMSTYAFETYSALDDLGRCGVCFSCIGQDLMPDEDRGDISSVKPTGWVQNKYDFVDGGYIYNRCHLIGYQLTGENANECNLITGTRYLNVIGMLPFENEVAEYMHTNESNHVLYRVTPIFEGDNLLASGVLMEAYSVEDSGAGVCFCIYCYNVQPGVVIDYATGDNYEG